MISKRWGDGWLYLLYSADLDRSKIGWSRNVEKRRKGLTTSRTGYLKLITSIRFQNAHYIEQRLKKHFSRKLVRNEWFDLDVNDINLVCNLTKDNFDQLLPRLGHKTEKWDIEKEL